MAASATDRCLCAASCRLMPCTQWQTRTQPQLNTMPCLHARMLRGTFHSSCSPCHTHRNAMPACVRVSAYAVGAWRVKAHSPRGLVSLQGSTPPPPHPSMPPHPSHPPMHPQTCKCSHCAVRICACQHHTSCFLANLCVCVLLCFAMPVGIAGCCLGLLTKHHSATSGPCSCLLTS